MQTLTSLSKYLILAVFTCSFIIAWECISVNPEVEMMGIDSAATMSADETRVNVDSRDSRGNVNANGESIWKNISAQMHLDHNVQSARVQKEIRRLLADQENFNRILKSAAPYIYYIYKQTQSRGLPAELALIPVIESEFNPNDYSTAGATGLWQLMPQTAKELGINVKGNYDGRRNVVYSTKAALAYFKDLGNLFNSNWLLAIAAYNCGQMRVASAIRRTGSKSFWNLPLPQETKYYVPRLLAVAAILKNPEKYGVKLPHVSNQPYFAELKVDKSVKLAQVAKSSGISLKTLNTLNPDYNHEPLSKKGAYTLLVPVNKVSLVKEKLADKAIKTLEDTSKVTKLA